jgi:hypothetical protein
MTTADKVELGSAAWLALAEDYLSEAIPALGSAVEGVSFSMCESFNDAPPSIADDDGRAAWWFEIQGPAVKVGRGRRSDVDVLVDVRYDDVLPGARLVYDMDNPEIAAALEERAAARRDAAANGDAGAQAFQSLPDEVRACLTGLHNFLAPRTA